MLFCLAWPHALTWCANVKPGDLDYPVKNTNPVKFVQFTAVVPSWLKVHFHLVYMPAIANSLNSGQAVCTYITKDGIAAKYSVSVPLSMSPDRDQGPQGQSFHGTIAVDRFNPGRCHWEFVELGYTIDGNAGEDFLLFRYVAVELPFTDSVTLWCTPVPKDYISLSSGKLRAVACQSEGLDKVRLLKRAAVVGSGLAVWNMEGKVGGTSIKALFIDVAVPGPPIHYIVP